MAPRTGDRVTQTTVAQNLGKTVSICAMGDEHF